MKQKWAFTIIANRPDHGVGGITIQTAFHMGYVSASSEYEARGMAASIADRLIPGGYLQPLVGVLPPDHVAVDDPSLASIAPKR